MSTFKSLNGQNRYFNYDARELVTNYILNPIKSPSGFRGTTGVSPDIVGSMDAVARRFEKEKGVQLRHFVVSYSPHELNDPGDAADIAAGVIEFIGQKYQALYAVHEDTENLHFHVMFNSVSYVDGSRYYGTKKEHYALMNQIKFLNHLFGINRLEYVSSASAEDIQ